MVKFCTNCGKQLEDPDNFCIFCGAQVKEKPVDKNKKSSPNNSINNEKTFQHVEIYDGVMKYETFLSNLSVKYIIYKVKFGTTSDDIKRIMQDTVYKKVFIDEVNIENNIDRYLYSINKKIFEQDFKSSAYIYAYINLSEYENNDIINAIEGIRYNMEKKEIKRRMVR